MFYEIAAYVDFEACGLPGPLSKSLFRMGVLGEGHPMWGNLGLWCSWFWAGFQANIEA